MIHEPYSVIVTSYNAENTIQNCLNSILRMEPKPSEIILIDDGSTDLTHSIIKNFENHNDLFLSLINDKNSGQSASRNLGAKLAKNEILLFLDDDDECTVERAAIHLEHFQRGADLSFTSSEKRYSDHYKISIINSNFDSQMVPPELLVKHFVLGKKLPLSKAVFAPSSTLAARKEIFIRMEGFDVKMRRLEDIEFICRSLRQGLRATWDGRVGVIRNNTSGQDKSGEKNFEGEMNVLLKNQKYFSSYDYLVARNMIYIRKYYFDGSLISRFKMIPITLITLLLSPAKLIPILARFIHDFRQHS